MSVAQLTANELGTFAAVSHLLDLLHIDRAVELATLISQGNAAAWSATYSDTIAPVDYNVIEKAAYDGLADQSRLAGHVGPLAYNMIANDGSAFRGFFAECQQDDEVLQAIRQIEEKVTAWLDGKAREAERNEENAAAFDEAPQLPTVDGDTIRARCSENGYQRVIVAEFMVDESDPYTDYHNGRTVRQVVVGYGKGKRESFAQLRKAAATFEPTAHMGPGLDQWTVSAHRADKETCERQWLPSVPLQNVNGSTMTFGTEQEARQYVDDMIAAIPELKEGECRAFEFEHYADEWGYEIHNTSFENRENYSMGGGNYLSTRRYSGWKVRSIDIEWTLPDSIEDAAGVPNAVVKSRPAAKKVDPVQVVESSAHTTKHGFYLSAELTTGKRSISVFVSRSHGATDFGSLHVQTSSARRFSGKYYRSIEDAVSAYRTENIQRMLRAFGDLVDAWENQDALRGTFAADTPWEVIGDSYADGGDAASETRCRMLATVEIERDEDAPTESPATPPEAPAAVATDDTPDTVDASDIDATVWL